MNLKYIKPNARGCMPIFWIEIKGHYRKTLNSKKFEPAITLKMVYKGPAEITATEELKKDFFKKVSKKPVSDTIFNTFKIVNFTLIKHLGYEFECAKEN
jgi:hypothetical protein